ncbi:hypothetical protein LPB03_04250 [Polaribacter vadi]|uniref:Uncharacterized protein n=1 Tax=Polaribacter vadi TaxID=1774273 RepID=A0A1B8TXZ8_9FLAO|nr:hypothetical protein [Polaribacter vadi]AOW16724.1 hypothetical protein LPB03_04250 [Polaribacter vadi]OBY64369.1 hypothetical protein LPB3_08245 [Polaribacter vadi]
MNERFELQKQFRQKQEKYVYYVIALSVASIGFVVNQTNEESLNFYQIPAGLAILSWGYSVYCGLSFMKYIISTLFANDTYLAILEGNHPEIGKDSIKQELAAKGTMEAIKFNSKTAMKLSKSQNLFFITGMILFLIWHLLEMFNNTLLS